MYCSKLYIQKNYEKQWKILIYFPNNEEQFQWFHTNMECANAYLISTACLPLQKLWNGKPSPQIEQALPAREWGERTHDAEWRRSENQIEDIIVFPQKFGEDGETQESKDITQLDPEGGQKQLN